MWIQSSNNRVWPWRPSRRGRHFPDRLPLRAIIIANIRKVHNFLTGSWWAWELFLAIVAACAVTALLAILASADGKPQAPWIIGRARLSLNTVVAATSTVARASICVAVAGALAQCQWNRFATKTADSKPKGQPLSDLEIFGEAPGSSRGCFRLIWRTKGWHLSALGALVMITSLAFDSFMQQVLATDRVLVLSKNESLIQSTIPEVSLAAALGIGQRTANYQYWLSAAPTYIVSAIMNASFPPFTAHCPTSDCTWPIVPSLGVCYACADLRNTSTWTFDKNSFEFTYSVPRHHRDVDGAHAYTLRNSIVKGNLSKNGFNLTNLTTLTTTNELTSDGEFLVQYYLSIPPTVFDLVSEKVLKDVPFYWADVSWDRSAYWDGLDASSIHPPNIDVNISHFLEPYIQAWRCSLYLCGQAYNMSTKAGIFEEHLESTWRSKGNGQVYISTEGAQKPLNLKAPSELWFQPRVTSGLTSGVSQLIDQSLRVTTSLITDVKGSSLTNFARIYWLASNSTETFEGLYKQIARSLSHLVRTEFPSPPDASYQAEVYEEVIITRVTWAWIYLPLAIFAFGNVFLWLTIRETTSLDVRPWRAHHLPLLIADVDVDIAKLASGGLATRTGLNDRIGDVHVRLEFGGGDKISFVKC